MVLETHMKLCTTEPDFPAKPFCPQNWENGPELGKICSLIFTEIIP